MATKGAKRPQNTPYAPRAAPGLRECCGATHPVCMDCMNGHHYGMWESQPAWAFEERACTCCGHYESRPLPEGEESW